MMFERVQPTGVNVHPPAIALEWSSCKLRPDDMQEWGSESCNRMTWQCKTVTLGF